jgi:hypothetical protein
MVSLPAATSVRPGRIDLPLALPSSSYQAIATVPAVTAWSDMPNELRFSRAAIRVILPERVSHPFSIAATSAALALALPDPSANSRSATTTPALTADWCPAVLDAVTSQLSVLP